MEQAQLFGTDRAVVYLEDPTDVLESIDGSRRDGIRTQTEKFLDSPSTAFDKKIDGHLHQVRHLNSNTRAFAAWCQDADAGRELCVVLVIYKKRNEDKFFAKKPAFNNEAGGWRKRFAGLSDDEYQTLLSKLRADPDFNLVE